MKHINPRVYEHQEIEFCRITANGYGGQGITFVEASNRTGWYIPDTINEVSGQVHNSENILKNDIQWCYLGESNTNYAVNNPGLALAKQRFVIKMNCVSS
ncbi:MAG: hypothetical protein GX815_12855 [Clostridiales bacterium]|nr:hypothetical protein [Clostridiales bacterium]